MPHVRKLTDQQLKEATVLWQLGWTPTMIANKYDVTLGAIKYHVKHIPKFAPDDILDIAMKVAA